MTCEETPGRRVVRDRIRNLATAVTYERNRDARLAESQVADVYDLLCAAERPELFLKDAAGRRTVGPGGPIAIRADAHWTVPEPGLAMVLGGDGAPLAVTIGNKSRRAISKAPTRRICLRLRVPSVGYPCDLMSGTYE